MTWKLTQILNELEQAGLGEPKLELKRDGGYSYHFGDFGLAQSVESDTWWLFRGLAFKEYHTLPEAIAKLKELLTEAK